MRILANRQLNFFQTLASRIFNPLFFLFFVAFMKAARQDLLK
jgi:threonine/homoserine/homoserine lactone efflux protein